jgi:hypothetical protein
MSTRKKPFSYGVSLGPAKKFLSPVSKCFRFAHLQKVSVADKFVILTGSALGEICCSYPDSVGHQEQRQCELTMSSQGQNERSHLRQFLSNAEGWFP